MKSWIGNTGVCNMDSSWPSVLTNRGQIFESVYRCDSPFWIASQAPG